MKKFSQISVLALCFLSLSYANATKESVSELISSGKEILRGIQDGIDDGRQKGTSLDGAIIVVDKDGLNQHLDWKVQSVKTLDNKKYEVTVIFRNNNEQKIRISNLDRNAALQLLDEDLFVTYTDYALLKEINIPERSAVREKFIFNNKEEIGTPAYFRIYGHEVKVTPEK